MKLTDKCKKDFEKWYKIEFDKRNLPYLQGFDISDLAIQFGVYVDFFDSVDIHIEIYRNHGTLFMYSIPVENGDKCGWEIETRQQARTEAIKQANIIYNERYGTK